MKNLFLSLFVTISTLSFAQNKSYEAFSESYEFETNKEYGKAIQALSQIPASETSYSIQLRLGWLHYLSANYSLSESYYNKAISLNKTSIEAHLGLIYPLSAMSNWDDVIKTYNAILAIDVNHSNSHYQLAYIYYLRKMYTESEAHLKKVLTMYPFDYSSNALLGSVYVKQGKIKEAKFHYNRALEYNPIDTDIINIVEGL